MTKNYILNRNCYGEVTNGLAKLAKLKTTAMFLLLLLFFMGFSISSQAQVSETVDCTPGQLSTLAASYLTTVTNLTVTGTIDARDFKTMRDSMTVLAEINLSGAIIEAYSGPDGPARFTTDYPANGIPVEAFYFNRKLTSFVFPSLVTAIGDWAFSDCSGLTGDLTVPSTVTSLDHCVFYGCSSLSSINIPSSVTTISSYALMYADGTIEVDEANTNYSSLDGILFNKDKTSLIHSPISKAGAYVIPSTVISIEIYAFARNENLTNVTMPSTLTTLGEGAFSSSGLTSISIPSSVTTISSRLFSGCSSLSSITIPTSVTTIDDFAFSDCYSLSDPFIISASVTTIGLRVFMNSSAVIEVEAANTDFSSIDGILFNKEKTSLLYYPKTKVGSYEIPSSVTAIGDAAFLGCSDLTGNLTIPLSVTSIGLIAFYDCMGLSSINVLGTTPIDLSANYITFGVDFTNCILYVPAGSKDAYIAADQWSEFENIIDATPAIPEATDATSINSNGFTANWNSVEFATNYYLDVATDDAFTSMVSGYDNLDVSDNLTHDITGLTVGTIYYYRVRASNPIGVSDNSNSVSATPKGTQVISFDALANRIYGSEPFTATAQGGASGNAVVFSSSDDNVATCTGTDGATITIVNAGSCTIYANQVGNAAYYDATEVSQTLTVTTKTLTVTADADQTKVYGETDSEFTYTASEALVGTDAFSGSLTRVAGEDVNTYAIEQGTLTLGTNYNMSFVGADFEITAKPITITADVGQGKVYGETDPGFTYTASEALVGTAAFSGSLTRVAGEDVNTYAIEQGTLALSANYNMSFVGADFEITKATLTATAEDKTKTEGEVNPEFTVVFTGFVFSDDETSISELPLASCAADENSPAGDYPIVVSGGSASNYHFSYVSGTLTIEEGSSISTMDKLVGNIYPNPTTGNITIQLSQLSNNTQLSITDISGKTIIMKELSQMQTTIDLSNNPRGVYVVTITNNNRIYQNKVILK